MKFPQRCHLFTESRIDIFTLLGNFAQVSEYVKEWLQYQNLWDMQAERLYERLGTDIQTWQVSRICCCILIVHRLNLHQCT